MCPSPFDFDDVPAKYAVMGNPVAHSKSPFIHSEFARQTGQNIVYTAIQVEPGGFAQAVGNFQHAGGHGLNITIPFKHEAWQLADQLSQRATLAESVNTLVFQPDGQCFGDNTDGVGLIKDITNNHNGRLEAKHILLLGAGGAAQGVMPALLEQQPASLFIANRTEQRAVSLARHFADNDPACPVAGGGFSDINEKQRAGKQYDLIINATAASLQGQCPPLPEGILAKGAWCYDLMYGDQETPFVRWGRESGAAISIDGLGMLVEQAAESFFLWRGVRPETAPVIKMLRD